jgi:hypothetical protein
MVAETSRDKKQGLEKGAASFFFAQKRPRFRREMHTPRSTSTLLAPTHSQHQNRTPAAYFSPHPLIFREI